MNSEQIQRLKDLMKNNFDDIEIIDIHGNRFAVADITFITINSMNEFTENKISILVD